MKQKTSIMTMLCLVTFLGFTLLPVEAGNGQLPAKTPIPQEQNPVAEVIYSAQGINFLPRISYHAFIVTVSGPDGNVVSKTFDSSATPYFSFTDFDGIACMDGKYTFELRVVPEGVTRVRNSEKQETEKTQQQLALVQSGNFRVHYGSIITDTGLQEGISRKHDVLHYDDVIITGSLCVGFDCVDGESFGFDTIKLKENNLRLAFEDTSTGTFPTNDWKIITNDTSSGGASYFAVQDVDHSKIPFRIEANAPSNALYVEDYGRIGLGTSVPVVQLHIVKGDTPTVRLDQDGSSGWSAQVWDLAGNESNFFIRDVTGGSKLPFRIQPATPTNTLTMKDTGNVGIGTWSPEFKLEVETTGVVADIIADRTDGAQAELAARQTKVTIGSNNSFPVEFKVNNTTYMTIDTDGEVGIGTTTPTHKLEVYNSAGSNAYCNGGAWMDGSSRQFKENIRDLSTNDALHTLKQLNPVRFYYKGVKDDEFLGFIAEDVPDLVATKERNAMSPMDVVAVLTKVVQEQDKKITQLEKDITELKKSSKR